MTRWNSIPCRITLLLCLLFSFNSRAQIADSAAYMEQQWKLYLDSVETTMNYQHGKVALKEYANLTLPETYKFIPADKAQFILHDLWGNPERPDVLGMVVKSDFAVSTTGAWAFIVTYDEDGFVKDEDAADINYDDLLKEMQGGEAEENKARKEQGYESVHIVDWAAKPYYDNDNKVLHWAKKIQFGEDAENLTLNYDVRILGRKGVLSMNAVGSMSQLADINTHIPNVLKMAAFTDGNKYSDFNPSMDKVAAYSIGGLIAGKLLAKAGILALLLKNIKLIALALMAMVGAFRNKLAGLFKKKEQPFTPTPVEEEPVAELAPVAEVAEETIAAETNEETKS
ncbi:DUF2167 domain-containing protein [Polluticoccus soli]|uniref:DUF2167 domain-containing protein n=1 Tax=Polluticoccus soli TaxID=3034150 RepID=UPI0023E1FE96|nr:DUF2167 domain-containing protein [Flavipsychrobacter sp. JY13-12]